MQKRSFPAKKNEKRINESIIARELMVISEDGEPLGKMSRENTLQRAAELDLDVVEV